MATPPANLQHAAVQAIKVAVAALVNAQRGISRAVELARKHGLSGDEIRMAFELAGLDFSETMMAVEKGVEL